MTEILPIISEKWGISHSLVKVYLQREALLDRADLFFCGHSFKADSIFTERLKQQFRTRADRVFLNTYVGHIVIFQGL